MYKFLSLVLFVFLTGCYNITKYPEQQETITKSIITLTEVKIVWHKDIDDIGKSCKELPKGNFYGCAIVFANSEKSICIIHAIEPNNFNDLVKLQILGHEFWHCLGARHR